jgi:hypothetical protein
MDSMKKVWVLSPHSGGNTIPEKQKPLIRKRILAHAEANYAGKYSSIDIKFKGVFGYIDAYIEPQVNKKHPATDFGETREQYSERLRHTPIHLCRLRYFDVDRWSAAFYTYSHERYEPCIFPNGDWFGTVEEGFDIGAMYLK